MSIMLACIWYLELMEEDRWIRKVPRSEHSIPGANGYGTELRPRAIQVDEEQPGAMPQLMVYQGLT